MARIYRGYSRRCPTEPESESELLVGEVGEWNGLCSGEVHEVNAPQCPLKHRCNSRSSHTGDGEAGFVPIADKFVFRPGPHR